MTLKLVWSMEANRECANAMRQKSFFINPQGKNVRTIKYECMQTMYDITKDPSKGNKRILPEFAEELAKKNPDEFTFKYICDLISYQRKGGTRTQRRFAPNDSMTIPPRALKNREPIETTLGRLIFYKVLVEGSGLSGLISYDSINKIFIKKEYDGFESRISDFLVSDKITTDQFSEYINRRDWLGLQLHAVVTVSFTSATTKTPPRVKELREKLFKQYDAELSNGDIITANKVENELIDAMLKEIKDDPGYDLYASGARGSVDNHMKNMFLMRGGVSNPNTGKYDIMRTSFNDGLRKEDFTPASNSVVHGAYHKA